MKAPSANLQGRVKFMLHAWRIYSYTGQIVELADIVLERVHVHSYQEVVHLFRQITQTTVAVLPVHACAMKVKKFYTPRPPPPPSTIDKHKYCIIKFGSLAVCPQMPN